MLANIILTCSALQLCAPQAAWKYSLWNRLHALGSSLLCLQGVDDELMEVHRWVLSVKVVTWQRHWSKYGSRSGGWREVEREQECETTIQVLSTVQYRPQATCRCRCAHSRVTRKRLTSGSLLACVSGARACACTSHTRVCHSHLRAQCESLVRVRVARVYVSYLVRVSRHVLNLPLVSISPALESTSYTHAITSSALTFASNLLASCLHAHEGT